MSGIKLPVTAKGVFVFDADGQGVAGCGPYAKEIAAALNAAPKRAFERLNPAMLRMLIREASQGVDAGSLAADQERAFNLVSLLQAFAAPVAPAWQPIETAPKGKTVLVFYRNSLGKGRIVKATFIERFAQESDGEEHGNEEYDEARDRYTWPEGWYEQIDNWEYAAAMFAGDHKPTHWMPLPAAPETQGGAEDA